MNRGKLNYSAVPPPCRSAVALRHRELFIEGLCAPAKPSAHALVNISVRASYLLKTVRASLSETYPPRKLYSKTPIQVLIHVYWLSIWVSCIWISGARIVEQPVSCTRSALATHVLRNGFRVGSWAVAEWPEQAVSESPRPVRLLASNMLYPSNRPKILPRLTVYREYRLLSFVPPRRRNSRC